MNSRISLLLALQCLFFSGLSAQQAGRLITTDGKEYSGLITIPRDESEEITITAGPASDLLIRVPANEAAEFIPEKGARRLRAVVDLDTSRMQTAYLNENSEPEIRANTPVWLETLVDGQVDLFQYEDETNKFHYFIRSGEDAPRELIYKLYLKENNMSFSKVANTRFRNQLGAAFPGCSAVFSEIRSARFQAKDLIGIVETGNLSCLQVPEDELFVAKNTIPTSGVELTVGVGPRYIHFMGEAYRNNLDQMDMQPGISYRVGAAYVFTPMTKANLTFFAELGLTSFRQTGMYEKAASQIFTQVNYLDLNFKFLEFAVLTRGTFQEQGLFYWQAGVYTTVLLQADDFVFTHITNLYGETTILGPYDAYATHKTTAGFVGGIGIQVGPLIFGTNLQIGSGGTRSVLQNSILFSGNLVAGIRL